MKMLSVSCLLLILIVVSHAQNGTIKGSITDLKTKELLIGTTILVKEITQGIITGFDGNFILSGNRKPCCLLDQKNVTVTSKRSYNNRKLRRKL